MNILKTESAIKPEGERSSLIGVQS